ncbi:MAG: periplasmic heavy metal sensor [Candidatus Obscuribacterales bacterium]|nr:periplasmic heavy metal sensor [Candidatus Obscuribacterales bacterium]
MNTLCKKNLLIATGGIFALTSIWSVAQAAKPSSSTTSTAVNVVSDGDSSWHRQILEHIEHRIFKIVHASEEQKEKLTSIFNSTYEQNADVRNELKAKVLSLSKAYADDNVTNDQIKDQITAINDLRAKLRSKRVEALLSAREVLTSKQRQILSERLSERFSDN